MPDPTLRRAQTTPRPSPGGALVLTAGFGTRLRPLSYTRAKPAVPVAGQSLIRRIARWLAACDVRDLVLNLHYRPETIAAELGDGSDLGVRARYSWEDPILGSAGGPRKALPLLDAEHVFLINGDTLTNVDLRGLMDAHVASGARVTLAAIENRQPDRYGGLLADDRGVVRAFVPAGSSESSLHFVGVQAVHRSVFADLPAGRYLDSIRDVYTPLTRARPGSVLAFVCQAEFVDVGTPENYLATALAVAQAEGLTSLPIGRGCRIAPSARVVDTAIWDDVEVGANAELLRCVVGDGARIPGGTRFEDCALVPASGLSPTETERVVGDLLIARMTPHHGRVRI
jgi:mannose-1-phosphate guanylyltransferase